MSTSDFEKQPPSLNRRQLMAGLAALGIAGSVTIPAEAQAKADVSTVEAASQILGEHFSPKDLQIIATALERNLEDFDNVRQFMVPDSIEPAPMFVPLRYADHPIPEMNIGMIQQDKKETRNA